MGKWRDRIPPALRWECGISPAAAVKNSSEVPQKLEHRILIGSSNSTSRRIREERKLGLRHVLTSVVAALLSVAKGWRQPECQSTHEQMDNGRGLHAMKCCSATRRYEVWILSPTWMDHENVMLREGSQTQMDTCHTIP